MKKRLLKKKVGRHFEKILQGKKLKVGDLITTCKGYNERIAEIWPEIWNTKTNDSFIWDYYIITTSGSHCSFRHCIEVPTKTKDEILEDWKKYLTPECEKFALEWGGDLLDRVEMIKNGKEVFTETGELITSFE